jgi:hypothetical protein
MLWLEPQFTRAHSLFRVRRFTRQSRGVWRAESLAMWQQAGMIPRSLTAEERQEWVRGFSGRVVGLPEEVSNEAVHFVRRRR